MKLTCLRGYSGSGKSTKAREIAQSSGAVVVCRDDLRMMLLGSYWTGKTQDEDRVTVAEEAQVNALVRAGTGVVVDATHLHPPYLRKWAKQATRLGADFEVIDCKIHPEVCLERDVKRSLQGERFVGASVIRRQAKQWPMDKWPTVTSHAPLTVEPVEWMPGLPNAIIVDIDGTLAHMNSRSPYDYTRVLEDDLDRTILQIVSQWEFETGDEMLIVSGRDHTSRHDTLQWLNKHSVPWDQLWMRNADLKDERGNKIPDYIVKYNIFNEHIRGKYNVHFVLDDRNQVVDMWRRLGLKCLQVAEGDF